MVDRFKPLNRNQLGKFLPNHESIKAFEQLIEAAGQKLPDAIDGAEGAGQSALALAKVAFGLLSDVMSELETVLNAPRALPATDHDNTQPRAHLGTIGAQNHDDVDIQGGTMTNTIIVGDQIIQGGSLQLDNDKNINWKDSGGSAQRVIALDAADEVIIANDAGGGVTIKISGVTIAHIEGAAVTISQDMITQAIDAGSHTLKAGSTTVGNVGFNGAAASGAITITGSRGGNVALANLLTALATFGLIINSTT